MKRKVFIQMSIFVLTILLIFGAILCGAIYYMIEFFSSLILDATLFDWITFIISILVALFSVYIFICILRNRIMLEEKEIFVVGQKNYKKEAMQYETHIIYEDILNIFLVATSNNSHNQPMKNSFAIMPYLIYECKDGSQKAINVLHYSKKQVIKIIDESIARAKYYGNDIEIKTGAEILQEFKESLKKKR